jgi:hypothetical protein
MLRYDENVFACESLKLISKGFASWQHRYPITVKGAEGQIDEPRKTGVNNVLHVLLGALPLASTQKRRLYLSP